MWKDLCNYLIISFLLSRLHVNTRRGRYIFQAVNWRRHCRKEVLQGFCACNIFSMSVISTYYNDVDVSWFTPWHLLSNGAFVKFVWIPERQTISPVREMPATMVRPRDQNASSNVNSKRVLLATTTEKRCRGRSSSRWSEYTRYLRPGLVPYWCGASSTTGFWKPWGTSRLPGAAAPATIPRGSACEKWGTANVDFETKSWFIPSLRELSWFYLAIINIQLEKTQISARTPGHWRSRKVVESMPLSS